MPTAAQRSLMLGAVMARSWFFTITPGCAGGAAMLPRHGTPSSRKGVKMPASAQQEKGMKEESAKNKESAGARGGVLPCARKALLRLLRRLLLCHRQQRRARHQRHSIHEGRGIIQERVESQSNHNHHCHHPVLSCSFTRHVQRRTRHMFKREAS